jgi:hypothetical protein
MIEIEYLKFLTEVFDAVNQERHSTKEDAALRKKINIFVGNKGYEIMYIQGEIGLYKDGVKIT